MHSTVFTDVLHGMDNLLMLSIISPVNLELKQLCAQFLHSSGFFIQMAPNRMEEVINLSEVNRKVFRDLLHDMGEPSDALYCLRI
jgi:hypothetical protein